VGYIISACDIANGGYEHERKLFRIKSFIWASDYPHIDASFGVVKEMRERLAPLPQADQRKVLGENAVRFYNLR
jgi:predicted TIM-barrel fold metal-dependent hydrolase